MPAGPVESGYVAHNLFSGAYDSIPSLLPNDADIERAREVLSLLKGEAGEAWARSGALCRLPPGKMDGVLNGLKKHSWETDKHLVRLLLSFYLISTLKCLTGRTHATTSTRR